MDRLQIMLSFLSIPACLMLFFKDRRFHTTEWLRAKPVAGLKYVTGKYCGTVLAWMLPAIVLTSAVNVWLGTQFTAQGYAYRFGALFLGMAVLALPAFMLAGAVIIVLGFLLHNEMAALPVFLVYLLFNITSGAFAADPVHPLRSIKFLIRLDGAAFADWMAFIPRQGLQLAVIAIVLLAGRMWGKQGFDGKGRL
ncbi:hypothetical protein DNH61_21225 [Paenibacillus sambharensis]|uniref:Uncharacterized protein n=1 Tax=Paenibacillus sambharensis TaxID=1803190 RepID=A0A2W1LHM8_9BACL|nr:hypothetical protein [Paenibacillus sambharensis]PZD94004.1 hypothetical protein DNH61_21225 [Paenibacillus sambharensis]